MPELETGLEEKPIEAKPTEKSRMTVITAVFLAGASLGGIGGVELTPSDIDDIVANAEVIELKEKHMDIEERKQAILDTLGKVVDTLVTPAYSIAPIETRDIWLDSTVQPGDKITVVIQHERNGVLIGNKGMTAEPTDSEVGGRFRLKAMNVR